MAHQLEQQGETVAFVGILDTDAPSCQATPALDDKTEVDWLYELTLAFCNIFNKRLESDPATWRDLSTEAAYAQALRVFQQNGLLGDVADHNVLRRWVRVLHTASISHNNYRTQAQIQAPIHLSRAKASLDPENTPAFDGLPAD